MSRLNGPNVVLVAGARPNFVKLAPLHRALLSRSGVRPSIVHTGQHYDDAMSAVFFRELGIPTPDVELGAGSGSHTEQTASIMLRFEPTITKYKPRLVIVFGDVNSTLACALVAAKMGIPVAHVEAGLRSNDWTMPEEINRVLTDRLSDRLYAPSRDACNNLAREGIPEERIRLVGNIMVDTLLWQLPLIDQVSILRTFGVEPQRYILVTLHRPSNVDDGATLEGITTALGRVAASETVIFPVHPRTRDHLARLGLKGSLGRTHSVDPLPYRTFLALMANARVVLTDSGGVQEETTALGVPCLTARQNTERPVTILEGTNRLVDSDPESLVEALKNDGGRRGRIPDLWDGRAAERIADDLLAVYTPLPAS